MGNIKQLAGQTAVYGISSILGRIINYLLVPLYTRVFLPHEAAIYVELYAYMAMLAVILTYGMETAFFGYSEKSDNPDEVYSTAFYSIVISSSFFLLITITSRHAIARVLGYEGQTEYIVYFLLILGLDAICAIPFAWLRARQKAWTFALIRLANIGANVVSNLVLILLLPWLYNNYQISWLHWFTSPKPEVSTIFVSNLIASALTVFLLMPYIWRARPRLNPGLWKEMFRFAWPLVIYGLAGVINETIDRILLKYLLPPATAMHDLGIYGMCFKISVFIVIFIQAFRYAAEPFFFRQSKEKNAPETYAKVMHYFIIVCFLMFAGIMLFMDVFKYFVGEKYYAGLVIVPLLLLGHIFLGIFYNLSVWYKITEMTRYGAWFSIVGTAVVLSLNFLLIPRIGYMGSAWANFSCYLIMMVLSWAYGQKYYPIPYRIGKFFQYLIVSLLLWLAGTYLTPSTLWLRLAVNSLLFAGFVIFILFREPELLSMLVVKKLKKT